MWLQLRLLETKLLDDSLALPKQADTDMREESDSLHSGIRLLLMLKSIAHSSPVLARSEVHLLFSIRDSVIFCLATVPYFFQNFA